MFTKLFAQSYLHSSLQKFLATNWLMQPLPHLYNHCLSVAGELGKVIPCLIATPLLVATELHNQAEFQKINPLDEVSNDLMDIVSKKCSNIHSCGSLCLISPEAHCRWLIIFNAIILSGWCFRFFVILSLVQSVTSPLDASVLYIQHIGKYYIELWIPWIQIMKNCTFSPCNCRSLLYPIDRPHHVLFPKNNTKVRWYMTIDM